MWLAAFAVFDQEPQQIRDMKATTSAISRFGAAHGSGNNAMLQIDIDVADMLATW
eukprot:m.117975 g.117975  ORF g.117975 m.117975 type:complete len:55 (+) comp28622_c1_seq1:1078-1242(+)